MRSRPAYAHVKACEPWAEGSVNVAEIGVISAEAASRPRLAGIPGHHVDADEGVVRVLLEGKFTFDLLDLDSDFAGYRLLILPDVIAVDAKLKAKVNAFVKSGGRVLLTGTSGIDPEKGFVFDVGAKWEGPSPYQRGRLPPAGRALPAVLRRRPALHVRSGGAHQGDVAARRSATSTIPISIAPRSTSAATSTRRASPTRRASTRAPRRAAFVYLAHPLFTAYKRIGAVAMLEIAEKAIAHALGAPA